jgi:hypothetical protein
LKENKSFEHLAKPTFYYKFFKVRSFQSNDTYYCKAAIEMRTTFCEMHLFNDVSQKHETSFILNRKEWGNSKTEREREKSERWSVVEEGLQHVS